MKYLTRFFSARYTFISILCLIIGVGYLLIYRLPDVYESSARLAIERADEFILGNESADSETLSQRAHLVISSVFRRENVLRNLQEQGVLDSDSTAEEQGEAVERFLDSASIEFDNVSVINPYTGKQGLLSLGLVINYRDDNADLAYALTSSLVEDVLGGARTIANPAASQTEEFLSKEIDASSQRLIGIGSRVAVFKKSNAFYLPELYPVAIRQLDELSTQIQRSKEDIQDLERDRAANGTDLAITNADALLFSDDGTRIESPEERLEKLRIERAFAVSRYSPRHPQVISLEREIAALEQYAGGGDTRRLEVEFRQSEARVATLRKRYSAEHPDVVAAMREVERLRGVLESAALDAAPRKTSEPSNPAYNRMLARRQSLDSEILRESRKVEQLEERHIQIQNQLAQMPKVEQELIELERLHMREEQSYNELERQSIAANLSSSMRSADILERFVVVEPPLRPLKPVAPRRNLMLGLLLMLGLSAASAGVLLRLRIQDAIWDQDDLVGMVQSRVVHLPRFD